MAVKLPFASQDDKEAVAEGLAAEARAFEPAGAALEPESKKREADPLGGQLTEPNPNATYIGDLLQRSGDIRLPLIGNLPLQRQLVIIASLLALTLSLAGLFGVVQWYRFYDTATQTQIAGDALMHSQRIGKAAPNAIQGNLEA